MKKLGTLLSFLPGAAFLMITAAPTYAVEVAYNTVGTFFCNGLAGCTVVNLGGGDSEVTVTSGANQSMLVYTHNSDDVIGDPLVTNFSAGFIAPHALKNGVSLNGISLDIKVMQTIPSPTTTGDFMASISGSTSINQLGTTMTTAVATFAPKNTPPPSITLDNVTYTLDNDAYKIAVPDTSIQGELDGSALPEPAFFTLTGIGFFGMFGIAYSRYKQRAQ